jgi:hypothetical protein
VIGLYLLAAHLVGDYVLQTRWQAAEKLRDPFFRARHVLAYSLAFVPLAVIYGRSTLDAADFMGLLALAHFATDSVRVPSTLGDVVGWWGIAVRRKDARGVVRQHPLPPPNPWAPVPLLVDQTLHVCQLAVLGGLLLG